MGGVTFRPEDIPDLSGQVIIVTGGNAGLGLETVRQLGCHNPARIYIATRSREKAEAAIEGLKRSNPNIAPISFLRLNLASFASVREAAETFMKAESRLDILINNAGIMMTPEGLTEDGYELQFGTNVMGHALLSHCLLPVLEKTAKTNKETRVVVLSSASERVAPKDAYPFEELKTSMSSRHTTARYCLSKLANIHHTAGMAERHADVKFISVHPGMVATDLHRGSTGLFLRPFLYTAGYLFATPVEKGALSQIWAAVSPDAKSGEFYGPVGVTGKGSAASKDKNLQEKLFEWVENELQGEYS